MSGELGLAKVPDEAVEEEGGEDYVVFQLHKLLRDEVTEGNVVVDILLI